MTTNWGGNVALAPADLLAPSSTGEVGEIVRNARKAGSVVKPIGAGHSFTAIAETSGVQLSLDNLAGIVDVSDDGIATVRAGTRLHALNDALWQAGWAMPNLGDIDRQSIAGAVATGTHGTGAGLAGLAASVVGLTLVDGRGDVVQLSGERARAGAVGLGALGVVTEYRLRVLPRYHLRAHEKPEPLDALLAHLDELADGHRHFEFFWFPFSDRALTKRNDLAEVAEPLPRWRAWLDDEFLSNRVFAGINRVVRRVPRASTWINGVSARALSERTFADASYRVFCSPRRVRFVESEYAVPREAVGLLLADLRKWFARRDEYTAFPVEVRFAAADDVWLSTAYGRDSAYVAVHQYWRAAGGRYFAEFARMAAEYGGRPHWGKMHPLGASQLRELYPRFEEFLALRDELDPGRVFANDYLRRVLGP